MSKKFKKEFIERGKAIVAKMDKGIDVKTFTQEEAIEYLKNL